jgi:hypothetical protein
VLGIHTRSWKSIVIVVIRLWAEQSRNGGAIPCRGARDFYLLQFSKSVLVAHLIYSIFIGGFFRQG